MNSHVEVYITERKKKTRKDGTKYFAAVRSQPVDVEYIDFPTEVFINGKLVYAGGKLDAE